MEFFLWLIIAFVLAPMILGPFVIKFTHWVSAKVNIKPVSPETLDHNVRVFIGVSGTLPVFLKRFGKFFSSV